MTVYAGFWRRFMASFIDGMILLIPSWCLNIVIPFSGILLQVFYKPVFESSPMQATPGKAMMGIVVQSETGETVTFKQALIRFAASFLSAIILFIGYLMNVFTARRQTMHDMIAQTVVIKKETQPGINYFAIWITEIKAIFNGLPNGTISNQNLDNNAAQPSAKTTVDNQAHAIETLHKLFQNGAISQEEFESKKQQILNNLSTK